MASTIFIDNTKDNKTAKKIDEQLFELSKQIEFALINPTNILHEKKLVHADPSYDPIFEYEKKDFTEVINELESLEMHDSEIGLLLEEKRKLSLHKAKSLHHRGTPNFTKHSLNAYGRGTKTLLEDAKKLLELNSEEREKTETPEKVVNALRAELTHHGFEYFVDSTDMSASAMVQPSKKRVLVNKHRIYSKHFVKVLLVHEIGTHV
ncbi:DUF1704 domain-containing protein, partial [Candidatus Woesearchaeota archaeon]|nr:DUF1704 domain-containing protein [Candidatus Woesearchaeota archaeon]